MKRNSIFRKIIFFASIGTSLLIVLSIVLFFLSSHLVVPLNVINLFLPLVMLAHLFFMLVLAVQKQKFFLVSFLMFLVSYFVFGSFYKFSSRQLPDGKAENLSVMTYNVWGFSEYAWMEKTDIGDKIISFIKREAPDIVCLQEHSRIRFKDLPEYPYRSETPYVNDKSVQAIFSKYPIVSEGSLDLPNSLNNIIFADILYKNDTLRVYNLHLQSYNIIPSKETFSEKESEKNYRKMTKTFQKQLEQAIIFREHRDASPYKTIVCGDLNNTQFSNVYRLIKSDMTDTFAKAGRGFGKTYNLKGYPMRIDYILADESFEVLSHQNFDINLSDHYPVSASLRLKSNE